MKRTLLLCALMVASVTNMQARKWDFTNWSTETIANLMTDSEQWSDIEKATATEPTDLSKENCYWQVSAIGSNSDGTLVANGVAIAELRGLNFVNGNDRGLAIALNYQNASTSTGFGPYEGSSYLWLGSSKKSYFTIPGVAKGAKITMGVESHKLTDARGVQLYIGSTSGTKLLGVDGAEVSVPTTYEVQTWVVPTDATDDTNEDGTYDILIYNTNGCHLYFIEVEDEYPVEFTTNVDGYATFFTNENVAIPDGVAAYVAELKNNALVLTSISDVIPANTAVILQGTPGTSVKMEPTTDAAAEGIVSDLVGTTAKTVVAAKSIYVLSTTADEGIGFYKYNGITIAKFKAYLPVSSVASAPIVRFNFGTTEEPGNVTAINHIASESNTPQVVYDLRGRRVKDVVNRGLYIVNGKKVAIQ